MVERKVDYGCGPGLKGGVEDRLWVRAWSKCGEEGRLWKRAWNKWWSGR